MLTKHQLLKAYDAGQVDRVTDEVRRYGTVTHDRAWDETAGHYAGANRELSVTHHGLRWNILLVRGEVRELGHD